MRGGLAIGVPLTLMQLGIHQHTGAPIGPLDVANNFAACHAVYDADRLTSGPWAGDRATTRLAALASAAYYASDERTLAFAPLLLALHLGYTRAKPALAPVKPFFVAAVWAAGIYAVPALRAPAEALPLALEPLAPASLFLSIASLSHAADVVDVAEDAAAGVRTPAVRMERVEAIGYTSALGFASAFLHVQAPSAFLPYDAVALAVLAGLLFERVELAVGLAFAIVAAHARAHDVELVTALLRSTETTHGLGVEAAVRSIELALQLPEPLQSWLVEATMASVRTGDAAGSALLDLYQHVVRHRATGGGGTGP
jgi:hypothetical protein